MAVGLPTRVTAIEFRDFPSFDTMNQAPRDATIIRVVSTVALIMLFTDTTSIAVSQTIEADRTVGTAVEMNNKVYQITGGQKEGANLFHSFEQFGLEKGYIADFKDPPPGPTKNIFGRVTGGFQSMIDGQIKSSIPGANLYLINPAGIVFGENASLDVSGSFYASTANEVRFEGNRFTFSAIDMDNLKFSSASPEAFGFMGGENHMITVKGSTLETIAPEKFALIGRSVEIENGTLTAGTMNIIGVGKDSEFQTAEEVVIEELPTQLAGTVRIKEGNLKANHIWVLGANVTINDSTLNGPSNPGEFMGNDWLVISGDTVNLASVNIGNLNLDTAPWGNVLIEGGDVLMVGNPNVKSNIGTKGNIIVTGERRLNIDGARFTAIKQKNLENGDIKISARGTEGMKVEDVNLRSVADPNDKPTKIGDISVLAENGDLEISRSEIDNDRTRGVARGMLTISAQRGSLSIDKSFIVSRTEGEDNAGDILISAKSLTLDVGTRISGEVIEGGAGRGADIKITADNAQLNGAEIIAESVEDAAGDAGNITLEIGDVLHLQGGSIISTSNKGGTGDGGDINISRRDSSATDSFVLTLANNSHIRANTDQGQGGDINIEDVVFFGPRQNITAFARGSDGVDGVIKIIGPDGDILSGVTVLPESYFENEVALQPPCGAAMEKTSGFVVHSAGGMPPTPDSLLASSPQNARSSVNKSDPSSKGPEQDGSFFIREVSHQTRNVGACAPTN